MKAACLSMFTVYIHFLFLDENKLEITEFALLFSKIDMKSKCIDVSCHIHHAQCLYFKTIRKKYTLSNGEVTMNDVDSNTPNV